MKTLNIILGCILFYVVAVLWVHWIGLIAIIILASTGLYKLFESLG